MYRGSAIVASVIRLDRMDPREHDRGIGEIQATLPQGSGALFRIERSR